MFSRTELLIGDKINILKKANIIVFGIGGVGGYVAEMLVRSGIENITLVDFDMVDLSNLNRQIIALHSTIGKYKVDVMKDRLLDINNNCNIKVFNEKLTPDNLGIFNLIDYDYIIDAIDMIQSKVALIDYAYKNNLKIISAMGAGNRFDIPEFKVVDIYDTYNDGLSKILRSHLRKLGITKHNVVFTSNKPNKIAENIGSIVYYPAMCGCVLSAYVINDLIKE